MLHFFECIIYNNIIDSITDTIISKFQFGFLANWSTVQLLLIFLNKIYHSHPNHHPTDTLYLDFKKAFDKIPHNKLLSKLWSIGITDSLWKLFHSYLSNCYQFVSVNGQRPCLLWHPLGPLLLNFIIFINDLPAFSNILLFADNTKCTKPIQSSTDSKPTPVWPSHHHPVQQMEHASWQIHIRFFPDSNPTPTYTISNSTISTSNLHKDLGIVCLTIYPGPHYHLITTNASTSSNVSSPHTKCQLYISLVQSKLLYCSQIIY